MKSICFIVFIVEYSHHHRQIISYSETVEDEYASFSVYFEARQAPNSMTYISLFGGIMVSIEILIRPEKKIIIIKFIRLSIRMALRNP